MNVNINNKNLFSQSLLINKFFFQKNSSHKQTGITTVDSGCQYRNNNYYYNKDGVPFLSKEQADRCINGKDCNGVQREHNKKLNNGLPILHKVPPKRDYGRYFCIMAEKGGTSHGGLTEKLSPFFHAKKQEVNAYGR